MELIYLAHSSLPDRALVGRYGGEEFCILLPGTDENLAMEVLEAFREKVEKKRFLYIQGRKKLK